MPESQVSAEAHWSLGLKPLKRLFAKMATEQGSVWGLRLGGVGGVGGVGEECSFRIAQRPTPGALTTLWRLRGNCKRESKKSTFSTALKS